MATFLCKSISNIQRKLNYCKHLSACPFNILVYLKPCKNENYTSSIVYPQAIRQSFLQLHYNDIEL